MCNTQQLMIEAARSAAEALLLQPLDAQVAARVVDFGLEALVECTLAQEQPVRVEANLRGAFYTLAIATLSERVAHELATA